MPPDPDPGADTATLLVVDDNEMNRDMLGRRLEKKGYRVKTAEDGPRALELVAGETIDLVLLDIEMPGLSGLDVLRHLRKTYNQIELPIIMATARSESNEVVEALEAGANDYVTKPLDFPVVLARVESQLRTRRKAAVRPESATTLTDAEAAPGKVLAGKYRLEARIGSGAFGAVYRARHVDLDHLVAVKVLQTAASRTPEALARFQREGIAACRIKHPNAVSVLDFGTTAAGAAFLVMELLEGHGLDEELRRAGKLPPLRCAEVIRPVCDVLAEAHQAGIVHRDIKPANVFLHRTSHGEVVKVLDFGIAKLVDDDARGRNLTVEGAIIGTPAYMAPERFRGATPSGSADVYSVGVMLFQMLTGQPPFGAPDSDLVAIAMMHIGRPPPPLRSLEPSIPPDLERVVAWALEKDAAARPAAGQFAAGLCEAVGLPPDRPGVYIGYERPAGERITPAAPPAADAPRAGGGPRPDAGGGERSPEPLTEETILEPAPAEEATQVVPPTVDTSPTRKADEAAPAADGASGKAKPRRRRK